MKKFLLCMLGFGFIGLIHSVASADATPPVIVSQTPSSGARVLTSTVNFARSVTDTNLYSGSLAFVVSGDPALAGLALSHAIFPADNTSPWEPTFARTFREQQFYMRAIVRDGSGNITTGDIIPFAVDIADPELSYTGAFLSGAITGTTDVTLAATLSDTYLSGAQATLFLGRTANFASTRPSEGMQSVQMTPSDSTATIQLSIDDMRPGTYYRYAAVTDLAGRVTTGAVQSFTISEPPAPSGGGSSSSAGGGGGSSRSSSSSKSSASISQSSTSQTSSQASVSSSASDSVSDDALVESCTICSTTRVDQWQEVFSTRSDEAVAPSSAEGGTSLGGFIRDVFTLLDIRYTGQRPAVYDQMQVPEAFFQKVLARLERVMGSRK